MKRKANRDTYNDPETPPLKKFKSEELNKGLMGSYNLWMLNATKFAPLRYYVPQEGDLVYFLKPGLKNILKLILTDLEDKDLIYLYMKESLNAIEKMENFREIEFCEIVKIEVEMKQPRSDVLLTMFKIHLRRKNNGETFCLNYIESPICQAKEFFVLKVVYDWAKEKIFGGGDKDNYEIDYEKYSYLRPGSDISVFFNQYYNPGSGALGVFKGKIVSCSFGYKGVVIKWEEKGEDDDDEERRSIWDILEVDNDNFVKEQEAIQFDKERECKFELTKEDYKDVGDAVNLFVESNSLFQYLEEDPYPVFLSVIRDRCKNFFYRNFESLLKDLKHVYNRGIHQAQVIDKELRFPFYITLMKTLNNLNNMLSDLRVHFAKRKSENLDLFRVRRKARNRKRKRFEYDHLTEPVTLSKIDSKKKKDDDAFKPNSQEAEEDEVINTKIQKPPAAVKKVRPKRPKRIRKKYEEDDDFELDGDEDEDEDYLEEERIRKKKKRPPKRKKKKKRAPRKRVRRKPTKPTKRTRRKKKVLSNEGSDYDGEYLGINEPVKDDTYVPPKSLRTPKKTFSRTKSDDFDSIGDFSSNQFNAILLNNKLLDF